MSVFSQRKKYAKKINHVTFYFALQLDSLLQIGGIGKSPLAGLAALGLGGLAPANTGGLNPAGRTIVQRKSRIFGVFILYLYLFIIFN